MENKNSLHLNRRSSKHPACNQSSPKNQKCHDSSVLRSMTHVSCRYLQSAPNEEGRAVDGSVLWSFAQGGSVRADNDIGGTLFKAEPDLQCVKNGVGL